MDMNIDIKLKIYKSMNLPRKQNLCPLCKSDCPSRRFLEFPLKLKDPNPTTLPFQEMPFQENKKPPLPKTPKSMQKIYKYMSRTPQVKRKVIDDLEFLKQDKQNIPTPHPPPYHSPK